MMKYVLAFVFLLFITSSVQAQAFCLDRNVMLQTLLEKYGEKIIGRGVAAAGHMIEILISPDGETWSIIITKPDNKDRACAIVSGHDWQVLTPHISDLNL